jgi:hypothetical protein
VINQTLKQATEYLHLTVIPAVTEELIEMAFKGTFAILLISFILVVCGFFLQFFFGNFYFILFLFYFIGDLVLLSYFSIILILEALFRILI